LTTQARESVETSADIKKGTRHWIRLLTKRKLTLTGGLLLMGVMMLAIAAPIVARRDPLSLNVIDRLTGPDHRYWFGTDAFGRDIFSRVVYGSRISLLVGLGVTSVSLVGGMAVGLVAGYYRRADAFLMRIMDGLMAVPSTVLAITLMAILGSSIFNVVSAIGVVFLPRMARLVRSEVLRLKEMDYINSARAIGAGDLRIVLKYLVPNCISPVIVQSTFNFASAVRIEASLSFLGVGVPPYIPSWGGILSEGRTYLIDAPWIVIFPGLAIMVTVLAINIFGDGLRDALDPRMRRYV